MFFNNEHACACACVRVHALPRITLHRRLQETEHPISSCIVYQQVMKGVTFNRYLSH